MATEEEETMLKVVEIKPELMNGAQPNVVLTEGSWIAGGSIRRWFTGEKQDSDVDVFFQSADDVPAFIKTNNLIERIRNDRMVMFKNSPVQVILGHHFPTPEATIDHFDFTICQFAWDGKQIISTVDAIVTTLQKKLAIHEVQKGYEPDTLRRLIKYTRQGFVPCIGTVRALIKAIHAATPESIAKLDEISPERWD